MERTVLGPRIVPLLTFVVALGVASTASAQCAEGRVANDQTQGRCCWPGQSWNPETALCTGPPACPAGRVAQGEDCVLSAGVGAAPGAGTVQVQGQAQQTDASGVPQAPAGYGQQQQQPQQQQQGTYYQATPTQPVQTPPMRTVTRPRTGLMIPGFIMFGAGYGIAVAVALTECYECGWFAVPFAGPMIMMKELDSFDPAIAYVGLAAWSLVQTAGVVMAILGLTLKREVQVRADLGNGRSIALQPWETPGGGGGLRLLGEF
jgi:hypothetical protein